MKLPSRVATDRLSSERSEPQGMRVVVQGANRRPSLAKSRAVAVSNEANARRDHEQSSQATGSLCTCYFCTSCPLQPDLLNEGAACT